MSEPQYRLEGIVHTRTEVREDFEGPLDVIFLLLSKNKIEIQDVSITAILEQYLAYLDEMKRLDMEIASEFITMASHLMLIKTKMLLSAAEQQEAEDELDLLRQGLIERRRREAMEQIRLAVAELEPRNEIGRCLFTKEPEPLKKVAEMVAGRQTGGVLTSFVDAAREIARESGAAVADAYADWQAMERSGVDTTALLANHINHPARDMHPLFVHRILEQLL